VLFLEGLRLMIAPTSSLLILLLFHFPRTEAMHASYYT